MILKEIKKNPRFNVYLKFEENFIKHLTTFNEILNFFLFDPELKFLLNINCQSFT